MQLQGLFETTEATKAMATKAWTLRIEKTSAPCLGVRKLFQGYGRTGIIVSELI